MLVLWTPPKYTILHIKRNILSGCQRQQASKFTLSMLGRYTTSLPSHCPVAPNAQLTRTCSSLFPPMSIYHKSTFPLPSCPKCSAHQNLQFTVPSNVTAIEEDLRHARLAGSFLHPGPQVREALQVHIDVLQAALRQRGLGGAAVRTRRDRVHHHGAFDHHDSGGGGGGGAGQPVDQQRAPSAAETAVCPGGCRHRLGGGARAPRVRRRLPAIGSVRGSDMHRHGDWWAVSRPAKCPGKWDPRPPSSADVNCSGV